MIIKRFMETQSTTKPIISTPNTSPLAATTVQQEPNATAIALDTPPVVEVKKHKINEQDDSGDEQESHPTTPTTSSGWLEKLRNRLFSGNDITPLETKNVANESTDNRTAQELTLPMIPYKFFTPEAEITDRILKGIVANLQVCNERLNLNLSQSEALRTEWEDLNKKNDKLMNDFNNLTKPFWKRKWFTISASTITLAFFLFQMYKFKALPNFIGMAVDIGSSLFQSTAEESKKEITNLPISNIQNTIKIIAETPVAPLTILTGVGIFTVSLGVLRLATFILRKIPK